MADLQEKWTKAKRALDAAKLSPSDVPPDFVMAISQGHDFGPALKKFDGAKTYEERMKMLPAVMKASAAYSKDIKDAIKDSTPKAKKALGDLLYEVQDIDYWVEMATQPPKPSGGMVAYYQVSQFNLAAGVKTEFLKLDPVLVNVNVEIDKTFKKLMDEGQFGNQVLHLGDAAAKRLNDLKDAFEKTILAVDATIRKDQAILQAKKKEAQEVLQYYARFVEEDLKKTVAEAWQQYLANKKYLSDFQVKTVVKTVAGVVGVGVAAASIALSFGAAWPNVVAIIRGVQSIAMTVKTGLETIDETFKQLVKDIEEVSELNTEREAAAKKGGAAKSSKGKQVAKELASALMPITKNMMKAASTVGQRCDQFSGQISKLEKEADKLSGQLEAALKKVESMARLRKADSRAEKVCASAEKGIHEMIEQMVALNTKIKNANEFAKRARKAVNELKAKDTWTGTLTSKLVDSGSQGAALVGLGNFLLECADHGTSLMKLMGI
jgi:methyl-accepting chemotaxis protein